MLVSHAEYADGTDKETDGRTPARYITLSAVCGERNKALYEINPLQFCTLTGTCAALVAKNSGAVSKAAPTQTAMMI